MKSARRGFGIGLALAAGMVAARVGLVLAALAAGCGSPGEDALFGDGREGELASGAGGGASEAEPSPRPSSGGGVSSGGRQGGEAGALAAGSGGAEDGGLSSAGGAEGSGGAGFTSTDGGVDGGGGLASSAGGTDGGAGDAGGSGAGGGDGCVEHRFFEDADRDGFGNPKRLVRACTKREGLVENDRDCYDVNPSAFPGQTQLFDVQRGDGSFDYDCDGEESREFTALGRCGTFPFCEGTPGWRGAAPACGDVGTWLPVCVGLTTLCAQPTEERIQRCL